MDWTQVLVIFGSNIGLWLWARSESRSDYRHMESNTNAILQGIRDDMKQFHEEMKGFNCRVCKIEEKK